MSTSNPLHITNPLILDTPPARTTTAPPHAGRPTRPGDIWIIHAPTPPPADATTVEQVAHRALNPPLSHIDITR